MAYELYQKYSDTPFRNQIWINWTVVTFIGATIGTLIASLIDLSTFHGLFNWPMLNPESTIAFPIFNAYAIIRTYIGSIVATALCGYIQWQFILCPNGLAQTKWVTMSIVGALLGVGLSDAAQFVIGINRSELIWHLLSAVIRGLVSGLVLWRILYTYSVSAKWWIPTYVCAIVLVAIFQHALIQVAGPIFQQIFPQFPGTNYESDPMMLKELVITYAVFLPINTIYGAINGLFIGIITGPVIATLVESIADSKKANPSQQLN